MPLFSLLSPFLVAFLPSGPFGDGPLPTGPWRAWLTSPGGELPFGLEFGEEGGALTAEIVNGPERIPVAAASFDEGELVLTLAPYDAEVRARLSESGDRLDGEWSKTAGPGVRARLEFHATRGAAPRFAPLEGGGPHAGLALRYAVDFASDEKPAVALFERGEGDTVHGTFLTATGDYRYLAGTYDGHGLRLSCFDGAHAFLFRAQLHPDLTLRGDFWSRDSWHDTWTATPDPEASLPDMNAETSWREGASLASIVLPDLDGNPRNLAAPEFAGRARIVQVFGSWCPNCHDETRFLVELHERYAERGLSILGLAFEMTGEFERDAAAVRAFAEHTGAAYPILLAGTASKADATLAVPLLDRVRSYPTTIVIDSRGRLRRVHTGWTGPATGEAYEQLRAEMIGLIEELLAEPEPDFAATWDALRAHRWWDRSAFAGAQWSFHEGEAGARELLFEAFGSGVRGVVHEERSPVRLGPDTFSTPERTWRLDRRAGVLLDPRDVGRRLTPDRESAAPLLVELGVSDEAAIRLLLHSPDPLVRREAVYALGGDGGLLAKGELPGYKTLLRDEDPDVRLVTTWAVGRLRLAGAVELLQENLRSPHAALRRESVRSLGWLREVDPHATDPIAALADDPDPLVRAAVEAALK